MVKFIRRGKKKNIEGTEGEQSLKNPTSRNNDILFHR